MILSVIAAVAENGVIGVSNRLPWRLPADLKRFKALTWGHSVIMGRRTFESLGKALPERRNLVISRTARPGELAGAELVRSFEEAIERCQKTAPQDEHFVIGGAQVYGLALRKADRIYLTQVQGAFQGDAYFPDWDRSTFQLKSQEDGNDNAIGYSFLVYERN